MSALLHGINEGDRQCKCDNCQWEGLESELGCDLEETPDLDQRLDPGSVVPVGECPECGCFAYIVEQEKAIDTNIDHILPESTGVWITCGKIAVKVNHTSEGVIVDLFEVGKEDHGSLRSLAMEHAELDEEGE